MKYILFDNNIVVRVVQESESDFEYHRDRGEGKEVANNVSVSQGNYIDVNASPMVIRESTKQDLVERHGAQTVVPAALLKPLLSSLDLTGETEEFNTWFSELENIDVDTTDDNCLLYSMTEQNKNIVKNAFGIIEISDIIERNTQYHAPEETTTTTTEAPAE